MKGGKRRVRVPVGMEEGVQTKARGEVNTEKVQREGSPQSLQRTTALLTPWPEHCDTYSRLFPDYARKN